MQKHLKFFEKKNDTEQEVHRYTSIKLTSARPLGPKTNKATTPITKASGAPTPKREAYTTLPLHPPFLSANDYNELNKHGSQNPHETLIVLLPM